MRTKSSFETASSSHSLFSHVAIPYMTPLGLYIQLRLSGWHPHKMSVYSSLHGAGQPFVPHVHHANPSTYFNIGQFLCLLNQFPLVLQSSLLDLRFLQSLLRFPYHCASDSRRSVFWYMCGSPARLWGLGGKAYPHPSPQVTIIAMHGWDTLHSVRFRWTQGAGWPCDPEDDIITLKLLMEMWVAEDCFIALPSKQQI